MKCAFITGIPASGKSHLAEKVSKQLGLPHIKIDDLREGMSEKGLKEWVNFFWNKDEKEYWQNTDCEAHWKNIQDQSEAFWPIILAKIKEIQTSGQEAVFEGVNILPHLAHADLDFQGIVLLGDSYENILARNMQDPRWGRTQELQVLEAKAFWDCERKKYSNEAEKYGFQAFEDSILAEKELLKFLQ